MAALGYGQGINQLASLRHRIFLAERYHLVLPELSGTPYLFYLQIPSIPNRGDRWMAVVGQTDARGGFIHRVY